MKEIEGKEYLLASEIADLIGPKWSRQRVHVELSRGKFPTPVTYVGNQPLWRPEQVQHLIKSKGREANGLGIDSGSDD